MQLTRYDQLQDQAVQYAMTQPNFWGAYYSYMAQDPSVQRGLSVVRDMEGTSKGKNPYAVGFGFKPIDDLSQHPKTMHSFREKSGRVNRTSAAGAYQFLGKTWDGVAAQLGLKNFGKQAQDAAAVALIDRRGGLDNLANEDLPGFVNAVGREWASMPTAPKEYDQPTRSWRDVESSWVRAGLPRGRAMPVPTAKPGTVAMAAPVGKVERGGALPPATLAPLATAPVAPVERSALPDISPLTAAPIGQVTRAPLSAPAMPGAYSRDPFSQPVDPADIDRSFQTITPPTAPALPAPVQVSPVAPPASLPAAPVGQVQRGGSLPAAMAAPAAPPVAPPAAPANPTGFPAAPSLPGFPDAPKSPSAKGWSQVGRGALTGLAKGGIPGAILGGLLGPAMGQIRGNIASNRLGIGSRINPFNGIFGAYRGLGLGGLGGMFTGIPAPNYSAPAFSVGSGYQSIGSVFGGPAGATAVSRSNPSVSFTSLGNGFVSRSNSDFGTTQTLGPGDYDPGTSGKSSSSKK